MTIRVDDNPDQLTRSRLLDTHPGGSISDAPLRPGETFSDGHVAVTAVSAGAGSATVSVNMAAPPLDQQAPSAPTGLSHVLLRSGLRLTWNGSGDNVGVQSYPVYRDGVEIGTAATNSFDDAAVTAGRHVYTVYAQDGANNRSAASAPYVVTVPAGRNAQPQEAARRPHRAAGAAAPAPPAPPPRQADGEGARRLRHQARWSCASTVAACAPARRAGSASAGASGAGATASWSSRRTSAATARRTS